MISNPDFLLFVPLPDHIFSKISKYRSENLHFPSTGKFYAPFDTASKKIIQNFWRLTSNAHYVTYTKSGFSQGKITKSIKYVWVFRKLKTKK